MVSIAEKIGCVPQTLHEWVKKADVDSGSRTGVPAEMTDMVKALERDVRAFPELSFVRGIITSG